MVITLPENIIVNIKTIEEAKSFIFRLKETGFIMNFSNAAPEMYGRFKESLCLRINRNKDVHYDGIKYYREVYSYIPIISVDEYYRTYDKTMAKTNEVNLNKTLIEILNTIGN